MPRATLAPPKTMKQFLAELEAADLSVAAWAKAHNFDRHQVYAAIHGRLAGRFGKARAIYRAMGVPPAPVVKLKDQRLQTLGGETATKAERRAA